MGKAKPVNAVKAKTEKRAKKAVKKSLLRTKLDWDAAYKSLHTVPELSEKTYAFGVDPGDVRLGISYRNVHTDEIVMETKDLNTWDGEKFALVDADYGPLVNEVMEQYTPILEETGWFSMERLPVRVAGGGACNRDVLMVQCHIEQYIRAKYPKIAINLVIPRSVKSERGASASTYDERKALVWKSEMNVISAADLKTAYMKWLTGTTKKGVPEVACDALEAAQVCAYGVRNRNKLVYHIINTKRQFKTTSMRFTAVPLNEQITKHKLK